MDVLDALSLCLSSLGAGLGYLLGRGARKEGEEETGEKGETGKRGEERKEESGGGEGETRSDPEILFMFMCVRVCVCAWVRSVGTVGTVLYVCVLLAMRYCVALRRASFHSLPAFAVVALAVLVWSPPLPCYHYYHYATTPKAGGNGTNPPRCSPRCSGRCRRPQPSCESAPSSNRTGRPDSAIASTAANGMGYLGGYRQREGGPVEGVFSQRRGREPDEGQTDSPGRRPGGYGLGSVRPRDCITTGGDQRRRFTNRTQGHRYCSTRRHQ